VEPASASLMLNGVRLDPEAGTLVRDGAPVALRARSFALLCHLALNRDRVVGKSDLLDAVWPDVTVTEDSLTQAVRDIRVAIGDEAGRVLRTVRGRGYQLVPDPDTAQEPPSGHLPRVAVLPFRDAGGPAERRPMLDALTETITAGLSRFRLLSVLSRHSAFAAAGASAGDSLAAARRIGADYVIDGTAWPSATGLKVSLALTSVEDGRLLWSERYDLEGAEVLGLQDLAPRQIVARLFATVQADGVARRRADPPERLSAFEHLARGLAHLRSYGEGVNEAAREHFARAIALDPSFGVAHSYWAVAELAVHDYRLAPPAVMRAARAAAEHALTLAPDEATTWRLAGYIRGLMRDYAAGEAAVRRALALNPSDAEAMLDMALTCLFQSRPAEAIGWLTRLEQIDPLYPSYVEVTRANALYDLRRYDEAAQALQRLPHLSVRNWGLLAACHAQLGRRDEALRDLDEAEAMEPGWDHVGAFEATYAEQGRGVDHRLDGIRKALAYRVGAVERPGHS
jgi:TolB-like protein/Flp pilus assembly protein TadD